MNDETSRKNIFRIGVILAVLFILLFISLSLYRISTSLSNDKESFIVCSIEYKDDLTFQSQIYERSLSEYYCMFNRMFNDDYGVILKDDYDTAKREIDIEELKYISDELHSINLIHYIGFLDNDLEWIGELLDDKAYSIIRDYDENGVFTERNYQNYYELRSYINSICKSLEKELLFKSEFGSYKRRYWGNETYTYVINTKYNKETFKKISDFLFEDYEKNNPDENFICALVINGCSDQKILDMLANYYYNHDESFELLFQEAEELGEREQLDNYVEDAIEYYKEHKKTRN